MILTSEEEEQQERPEPEEREASPQQEDTGSYDRLFRRRKIIKFLVKLLLLLTVLLLLGAWFYYRGQYKYDTYQVVWEKDLAEGSLSFYAELSGNLIKYSRDGASCIGEDGETIWTQSFEMKNPIVDICQDYMIIAEQQGYQFYIFNSEGLTGSGTTNQPITKASVAATGTCILLTERDQGNDINYYDKTGAQVRTGIRTVLSQHGVAMDIDLSPSGMMIAASFIYLNQGTISNKEIFYNFSEAGKEYTDRLVGGFDDEYKDSMIGETAFLDDSTAVVFAEGKVDFYSLKNEVIPRLSVSYPFEREIESIFYNDLYVGVITLSPDESSRYQLTVYNSSGTMLFEKLFNMEYTNAWISGNTILITNNSDVLIFNTKGQERYNGALEGNTDFLVRLNSGGYLQVSGNKLRGIVLK